ncbi:hypothetical protein GX50_04582 [[Emmonsia] crescens]|uniref:Uncharacterized protein n=1 Tax=[Emmonsia] crescens TaxID=73230 RepID=A0A2B7ZHF7_9EURO|nr:hypothetical protein GX50_04582 [Emmonsia crescens]
MAHDAGPEMRDTTPNNARTLEPRSPLFSAAQAADEDMTAELQYTAKSSKCYNKLAGHREETQQLVAFYCGLANPDLVQVPRMFGEK